MASVRVEQRNAHLAGAVRLEYLINREGRLAKAVLTAISNTRRGEAREEESTAVQWTLWGKLAECANEYLGKGSHVNIVGRLRNNNYQDKNGVDVYAFNFVADEVDFLDSKAQALGRDSAPPEDEGWGESSLESPARRASAALNRSSSRSRSRKQR